LVRKSNNSCLVYIVGPSLELIEVRALSYCQGLSVVANIIQPFLPLRDKADDEEFPMWEISPR
jgi:hypothetical protein